MSGQTSGTVAAYQPKSVSSAPFAWIKCNPLSPAVCVQHIGCQLLSVKGNGLCDLSSGGNAPMIDNLLSRNNEDVVVQINARADVIGNDSK
jgi:hypothetical protein